MNSQTNQYNRGAADSGSAAQNSNFLRRSPPRRNLSDPRDQSPHEAARGTSPPQTAAQKHIEEQKYEQRRQEELRRQIRQKEQELEQISSQKQRFKERIDRTLGMPQGSNYGGTSSLRQGSSPLTQTRKPYDQQPGNVSDVSPALREQFPQRPDYSIQKPASPLRASTIAARPNLRNAIDSYEKTDDKFEDTDFERQQLDSLEKDRPAYTLGGNEYASQLKQDNQQLQRRLNLVVAELDRVTRDMQACKQSLNTAVVANDHLQSALNNEQKAQDDHTYNQKRELLDHKDINKDNQLKISQADTLRADSLAQLRALQAERDRRRQNYEELNENHRQKVQLVKQLEHEKGFKERQLDDVDRELQILKGRSGHGQAEVHDTGILVGRLQNERDELMTKLQGINANYDQTVVEISRERVQLESHNKRHTQLLTAKAIMGLLKCMIHERKQAALNEFFSYCQFDEKCHTVLKKFSVVLQNCGEYQMRMGLQKWFSRALKPVPTRRQKEKSIVDLDDLKRIARAYNAMAQAKLNQGNSEGKVKEACHKIWAIKCLDVHKEINRYFGMWRDKTKMVEQRMKVIYYLSTRVQSNRMKYALNDWRNLCVNNRDQAKYYVYRYTIAQNQFKGVVFHQFRAALVKQKRMRLHRLRHLWKGWRDWQSNKKYVMASICLTSQLNRNLDHNLLQNCWEALRLNMEESKHQLMTEQLTEDMHPSMLKLQQEIEAKSVDQLRQRKLHALDTLSRMANAKLTSYFQQWVDHLDSHTFKVQKNFKELLCKRYNTLMHQAWACWVAGKDNHKQTKTKENNEMLMEQGNQLTHQAMSISREIENNDRGEDKSKRTSLKRSLNIFQKRALKWGFNKWAHNNRLKSDKEGKADWVIEFIRKHRCKQAWARYVQGVKSLRLQDQANERAEFFKETLRLRSLRKYWNAFCQFQHFSDKQRTYSSILLQKIDYWMKKRAFLTWRMNRNQLVTRDKTDEQNMNSEQFDDLTHELRKTQNEKAQQMQELNDLKEHHKKNCEKSVGNNFMRMYYSALRRSFEKWAAAVRTQKHCEDILSKTIKHWQNYRWYYVKAAFQQWAAKCQHEQTVKETHECIQNGNDHEQMNEHNRQKHDAYVDENQRQIDSNVEEATELDKKLTNTVTMLIRRSDDNYFQSKLRFILLKWREHTKRQIQFATSINNTIRKTLMQQGFDNINAFSQDKALTRDQNDMIIGMRNMFWRNSVGRYFSHWKGNVMLDMCKEMRETDDKTAAMVDKHNKHVNRIHDWNSTKSDKLIYLQRIRNHYRAWRRVTMWQKAARVQKVKFDSNWQAYLMNRYLKKWHTRGQLTITCRDRYEKFMLHRAWVYKKAVFQAILREQRNTRKFCNALRQGAEKVDHQQIQDAFQTIKNYSSAKKYSHERQKRHAANDLSSALHQLYLNRMAQNLSKLRFMSYEHRKRRDNKVSAMMGHWYSRRFHDYFQHWRNQTELANLVEDVNERGPVVEEVLHWKQEVDNIKHLMDEQGYEKKEIEEETEKADKRQQELLARAVARWQNCDKDEGDEWLKGTCFDRWREYVRMRKLIGFLLNNMENRLQPYKADLSIAFNRWKFFTGDTKVTLKAATRNQQQTQYVNNLNKLENMQNKMESTEEELAHMGMQRDELIENYMKAQRLALALNRENMIRGMSDGLNRLSDHSHSEKKAHLEEVLQQNLARIAATKDKIREFEDDNESIAAENEELRQFSLDGYQIAKNVQNLGSERERLSVDLADKTNTIKKLLDENAALQLKLRKAQENASQLIQMSNRNMAEMRGAGNPVR